MPAHLAPEGDDTENLRDTAAAYPAQTAPLTDCADLSMARHGRCARPDLPDDHTTKA